MFFAQFKARLSIDNLKHYYQVDKEVSRYLRKRKRQVFHKFCGTLHANSHIGSVWSTVKAFTNARSKYEYIGNRNCLDPERFQKAFKKIAPMSHSSPPNCDELLDRMQVLDSVYDNSYMSQSISSDEYYSVVKSLKIYSAPGPDLITNFIVTQFHLHN